MQGPTRVVTATLRGLPDRRTVLRIYFEPEPVGETLSEQIAEGPFRNARLARRAERLRTALVAQGWTALPDESEAPASRAPVSGWVKVTLGAVGLITAARWATRAGRHRHPHEPSSD